MAKALKMMDDALFAILIWALIYATIFAPLIFRKVLARYMAKLSTDNETTGEIEHRMSTEFQMSGHLPDLEAEAKEEKSVRDAERLQSLETENAQLRQSQIAGGQAAE